MPNKLCKTFSENFRISEYSLAFMSNFVFKSGNLLSLCTYLLSIYEHDLFFIYSLRKYLLNAHCVLGSCASRHKGCDGKHS